MRALSRLALGILRRRGQGGVVDREGARYRISEARYNEFRLTLFRPAGDQDQASTLDVRFEGKIVLRVEWLPEAVIATSYRPGDWEATLRRYDQVPALGGMTGRRFG
jgi:hypothetical protein